MINDVLNVKITLRADKMRKERVSYELVHANKNVREIIMSNDFFACGE